MQWVKEHRKGRKLPHVSSSRACAHHKPCHRLGPCHSHWPPLQHLPTLLAGVVAYSIPAWIPEQRSRLPTWCVPRPTPPPQMTEDRQLDASTYPWQYQRNWLLLLFFIHNSASYSIITICMMNLSLLYSVILCYTVLYCVILCCTLLYCVILCYTVLYCVIPCYTVLYCVILCCACRTELFYI